MFAPQHCWRGSYRFDGIFYSGGRGVVWGMFREAPDLLKKRRFFIDAQPKTKLGEVLRLSQRFQQVAQDG